MTGSRQNPIDGPVSYQRHGNVAVITIERVAKRNALDLPSFRSLHAAADCAATDDDVGAVLVRGQGGVFSAGIDLGFLERIVRASDVAELIGTLQAAFTAFEEIDKPSIAAIEGYCFGAGLQLALACHLRCVTRTADLSLMESRWGLVPDLGGTFRLPRLVGLGRATELAVTARHVPGEEALAIGLAEVELGDADPQEDALALARRLADKPHAIRGLPRLLRENLGRSRETALQREVAVQLQCFEDADLEGALEAR